MRASRRAPSRTCTRSSTTPSARSSSSRTRAAAARSVPASRSASARTRPGTSPSRRSASWSAPAARSSGVTIGNDVSSREIEGANPLYLPQAKVYAGACALGPAVLSPRRRRAVRDPDADPLRDGRGGLRGRDVDGAHEATFEDLVAFLLRENPVPPGSVLLTGTGLVPPDDFTLEPGQLVEIEVPGIGILANPVVPAASIVERSLAHV